MPSPAFHKNNPLTQFMDRVQQVNAAAGMPAGRGASAQPVQVGSGPSVRSAAMQSPPPLSPEEQSARDARARELGIMPPAEDEAGPYADFEAAAAAGGAVPSQAPVPTESRQTAREFLASQGGEAAGVRARFEEQSPPVVRLPDFRKISGFDFYRNVLYIDGLEFPIPEEDVLAMKRYAIDIALDSVVKHLADALIAFGVPAHLAQATADSVREGAANAASQGQGEGTPADVEQERLSEGGDQETPGPSSAE